MKNFALKYGGRIILILLVIRAAVLFYDEEKKSSEVDNKRQTISQKEAKKELEYKIAMGEMKAVQETLKKKDGWVREYGRFSGELTVETFYKDGIVRIHKDYSFNKKMRELYWDDEHTENYREVLFYLNSGKLMSDITYKNKDIVKGKCFDLYGKEYDLDKKRLGNGAFGPVSIPSFDEVTKKELNTTTYNDTDSGTIYTLCQ
ncbi:MAG: hypothetical protein R3Y43_03830 [Alphaproteobacteria bacterium]